MPFKDKEKGKKYQRDYHIKHRNKKNKLRSEQYRKNYNPKKNRERLLLSKYSLTLDDYNTKFEEQKGKCAICKRHQSELNKVLFVDHNHITNKVRGLLCDACNTGIGYLKEDFDIFYNAISYLKFHENKQY